MFLLALYFYNKNLNTNTPNERISFEDFIIKTIKSNLENFNVLDKSILLKQDYLECLNYLQKEKVKLDIVFLDPPYKDMIMERIIDILIKKDLLTQISELFLY